MRADMGDPPYSLLLDTNVVIDLLKLDALAAVARLDRYTPRVVEEVRAELLRPEQSEALDRLVCDGLVGEVSLDSLDEQTLFAQLATVIGQGEAACLSLAHHRGAWIATDETNSKLMREARRLIDQQRLVRTPALLAMSIQAGLVTASELEAAVERLATSASSAREHDDVRHLERVLERVREQLQTGGQP